MKLSMTSRLPAVIRAKLAILTFASLGLAVTLNFTGANTLSLLHEAKALPSFSAPGLVAKEPSSIDLSMNVLSPNDAARYRAVFAAQRRGDWEKADEIALTLNDKRLVGYVLAYRYRQGLGGLEEMKSWLSVYADLSVAEAVYRQALAKATKEERKSLPRPILQAKRERQWSGGGVDTLGGVNFSAEIPMETVFPASESRELAQDINRLLRKKGPAAATERLKKAIESGQSDQGLISAAEAAISAGYFYMGEREQAKILSGRAAESGRPLAFWVRGLIAWEEGDYQLASAFFSRLAGHPDAGTAVAAAARFWSYRSLARQCRTREARRELEKAAADPRSFYGFLAAGLLGGEKGGTGKERANKKPAWDSEKRAAIAKYKAGWRALALIQAGETDLAEAELLRLNPQDDTGLREAMAALAAYARMPALSFRLAGLPGSGGKEGTHFHPLPRWRPQGGFAVDRSLVYALAHHESRFDPEAVSVRGARGLMQIMPATAMIMDGKAGWTAAKLSDPEYNLELGQKYVRHLASQPAIGDNLLLLLAAYNGGPAKVARWLEAHKMKNGGKKPDPLLFIETIPQRETRNYITAVLSHYWAYRTRLGEPLEGLRHLAEGKWPRLPAAGESPLEAETPLAGDGLKMAQLKAAGRF